MISVEEARQLVNQLLDGMSGLKSFKEKGAKFVMKNHYVEILPQTGHRLYWWNFDKWQQDQSQMTSEFWEDYRMYHKNNPNDPVARWVKEHFQIKSKWCDRYSLNAPTQGGGAVVLKTAMIELYNWIIDNGYWGKILIVNLTHDECNSEFPKELKDIYPKVVSDIMEKAAATYYHKLPIPAEAQVGEYWIH